MITTTHVRCGLHGEPLSTDAAGRLLCPVEGLDCTSWSDLQPQHNERVRREADGAVVVVHEDGLYGGLYFDVEGTGGMCRALVREMEDSSVLTITDGMAGLDFDSTGEVVVAIYSHADDWDDSGAEPVYTLVAPDMSTALAGIARVYREV
jgi:hypothetical protein